MLKRLLLYLNEMFPITSFVGTLLTAFAIQLTYLRLFQLPAQFHYQMLFSGIVITAVSLLIRVMDEFKDFEDDKVNFPLRPLPSGKVRKDDLKVLASICVFLIIVLSLTSKNLFIFGLCTLGYTFLMLKWFFLEKQMRRSLPLAFVSHHPIVLFNVAYLILGMIETYDGLDWSKAILILPIALIFSNWELARKIRSPEQETNYTTYSKILGPRVAVIISLLLQASYIIAVLLIFSQIGSPVFLSWVFCVLMLVMALPSVRFLVTLKLKAPLKMNAESQILLVIGFLIAATFSMKYIYLSTDNADLKSVGGKGLHLQKLQKWHAKVAPFFVVGTDAFDYFQRTGEIHKVVESEILQFLKVNKRIALRSSMIGEDQLDASFAGLFETVLGVEAHNWKESLIRIFMSVNAQRVKNYISQKGLSVDLKMAVVVQQEIQVQKSGVIFTRSPISPTSYIAIDAALGMGEGVVSGLVDVDHYLMTRVGELIKTGNQTVLSEAECQSLFKEAMRLEKLFGCPADIEWGFFNNILYIFQIRPITTEFKPLRFFADTNLSESYPGALSPFSVRFVQKAYENVFMEAATILGMQHDRLAMLKYHCAKLIGSVDNHLYYNLEHYYAVLRSLPGGEKNIQNWHRMIGGKIENIEVPFHSTYLSLHGLALSGLGLCRLALLKNKIYPEFISDLNRLDQSILGEMKELKKSSETIVYLNELIEKSLNFGLTIINDFFIMLGLGILTSSLKKKKLPENALIDLLRTSKGLDSIKPLEAFNNLTQNISDEFLVEFEKIEIKMGFSPYQEPLQKLHDKGYVKDVAHIYRFLEVYGHRSFEELKLESLPLNNDPELFKKLLRWGKGNPSKATASTHLIKEIPFNFLEKKILQFTRECIEYRETTRLWRGRFYHHLRELVIKLAFQLTQEDVSWKFYSLRDFFSVTHEEWLSYRNGKISGEEIKQFMSSRNWNKKVTAYPEFLVWCDDEKLPQMNTDHGEVHFLKGQGVSPGVIEAKALVLESPTEVLDSRIENFILVTKNTDPAWVYIMSRSKGLISEKGSMLSHTAIIGRELGIPTIVGVKAATHLIKTGDMLRIDGTTGELKVL